MKSEQKQAKKGKKQTKTAANAPKLPAKKATAPKKQSTPKKAVTPKKVMEKTEKKVSEAYAIFQTGGKQYQAIPGKTVAIEKLDSDAGASVSFSEVLFRKNGENSFEFGQPYIKGAAVKASILKQAKGPKVIIFKFQRRKKRRTKTGHRQPMSIIRIESV